MRKALLVLTVLIATVATAQQSKYYDIIATLFTTNITSLGTNEDIAMAPNGTGRFVYSAETAEAVPYLDANKKLRTSSVSPSNNDVLTFNSSTVAWEPRAGASGDITAVIAGSGLSGGCTSGDCTLSLTTDTTNASNISSGTLPAGRLPALTGDVTSSAGSAATVVEKIQGIAVSTTDPTDSQVLLYNSSSAQYVPTNAMRYVASYSADAQTANISATDWSPALTPAADTNYFGICQVRVTTVAATSSTLPLCAIRCREAITDATVNTTLATTNGTNVVNAVGSATGNFMRCKAGTAVQILTAGYASNPATTMQYSIRAFLYTIP